MTRKHLIKAAGESEKGNGFVLPDLSCLIRPLLVLGSMGRKSLNQVISGSGLPLAAHSIVAVRVRSTTFSCGPMSMLGKPAGSWSSVRENRDVYAMPRFSKAEICLYDHR